MTQYRWILLIVAALVVLAFLCRYAVSARRQQRRKAFGFDPKADAVTLAQVMRQIESEEQWTNQEYSRLSAEIDYLKNPQYETMAPEEIVALASHQERSALQEITGATSLEAVVLVDDLRSVGSNGLAQFIRVFTSEDINVSYREILNDACKHVGAKPKDGASVYWLEVQLQRVAFERLLESMPAANRQQFLRELASQSQDSGLRREAILGGGIAVANLSGFGLYLASSTALGAITSAIGVTLPFAVYTGMSSTLAVLVGPIGWVALGAWVIHKLGKPNPNKVLAGTLLIANIRQRLISTRDQDLPRIKNDRDVVLVEFRRRLAIVKEKVCAAAKYALNDSDRVDSRAYATPSRPKLYERCRTDTAV